MASVENTEFKIVQDKYPDELLPGEAIVVDMRNGNMGLIFGCPHCGKPSYGDKHIYNVDTQTITPSIVHEPCGWHGFLRNGKFSTA